MTPKQAILSALNGKITRQQLMDYCGIINKNGVYHYKRKERIKIEFTHPTLQEVIDFFYSKGYNKEGAKKAYDYYNVADWKDAKGKQIINWKQKMIGNWLRDEYKIKSLNQMHRPLILD